MPSVSFSLEMGVDTRLQKAKRKYKLETRTATIDKLLTKAGF